MFAVYPDRPAYRKFLIGKRYTVFYIVDDAKQLVLVAHIIPAMMDIGNILG
ncbi:hypothetical protein [Moraxella catarrhalis]|nr:hypothetical protein [Moraxella catarrhalis]